MNKILLSFFVLFAAVRFSVAAQDAGSDASKSLENQPAVAVEPEAVPVPETAPEQVAAPAEVPAPAVASAEASVTPATTANPNAVTVQGTVSEIAADGTYVIVNDGTKPVKFTSTKDFLDEAYMEVGDKVKIIGENSDAGLKIVDYDYIFDDVYDASTDVSGEDTAAADDTVVNTAQ